ncbi:MAG: DUF4469 domain-containing protein [Treponemataceae bacterium]
MLEYSLRKNLLDKKELSYMAQVSEDHSCSNEQLITLMANRGTTITRSDIVAVLQLYEEVLGELISSARPINTSIINTHYSIKGKFEGMDDSFDHSRHTIAMNVSLGVGLKDNLSLIKTFKVQGSDTNPLITEVADITTHQIDSQLTKGGSINIIGRRLKFDESDIEQGIFLIAPDGSSIKCPHPAQNKPSQLIVNIPLSIDSGTYYIEVRTKLSTNSMPRKNLKIGRFKEVLHIS